jgi:cytidylate kinase
VHVRLVGSFEKRVAHMQEYLNLNEKQARDYVIKGEHDRVKYIKRFFQKDLSDVSLYDIVINTDTVSIEKAVRAIGEMVLEEKEEHAV